MPPNLSRRSFLTGALTAATAGAVGLGLAGCAGDSRTVVRFHSSKPESIPYFRELVARYNQEQSGVRVVLDTATNLQAAFLRGSPPDIGCLNYNMEMARFMERGALSDLSDMPEAGRIRPEVQQLADQYATFPGRTSVLPFSVAAESVIYNKALFAEHDVPVPTTWSEFLAVCETFQAAGVAPMYGTFKDSWTLAQGMFDYTLGGLLDVPAFFAEMTELGTAVGPDSRRSFQRDFLPSMERMRELVPFHQGDANSRAYGDGNLAFARGEAAMYLQGPWVFGELAKTDPDLSLGTFPLPMTENPDDRKVRVNLDLALWIPEGSRNQEAARDFVAYLMRAEQMDDFNSQFLGFGTTTDAAPATDERIQDMQEFYDDGRFYLGPSQLVPLAIPLANHVQSMVLGADLRSTLAGVDADWARLAFRA
ncbi:ABC transporter substrate-binding protein [Promicromonospora sukumoe]|uniref:ABC transporter substrate-binding protein n=1 Tax=Promicromonospora sukumoe TaxID=88382 RepID=UPI0037C6A9DB